MENEKIFSVTEAKRIASVIPSNLRINDIINIDTINSKIQELAEARQTVLVFSFVKDGADVFKPSDEGNVIKFHENFNFYDDGSFIPLLARYRESGYDVCAIHSVDENDNVKEFSDFILSWDSTPVQPVPGEGYKCTDIAYFSQEVNSGMGMSSPAQSELNDGGEW